MNNGFGQSNKINIKTDNLPIANYLQMDDFYLTHYLYIDLFLRENLFPSATAEDVNKVLNAIKTYVSDKNTLEIEIDKPGKRNYIIKMAVLKKEDGTELLIAFTNWNVREKIFEKEIKMENDSYTRWYFLNNDKMTYRKDMSDQNDYENASKVDLANAYLLDEIKDNDSMVDETLEDILSNDNLSEEENIMANLILLKNEIFKRNKSGIADQVDILDNLFENAMLRHGGLIAAFNATKFQIDLMQ